MEIKGVYTPKLKAPYTVFLHSIKRFEYKLRKKFNEDSLVVEQNNYISKIVNAYIIYDLDNLLRKFTLKNCLFGATTLTKNSDKKVGV